MKTVLVTKRAKIALAAVFLLVASIFLIEINHGPADFKPNTAGSPVDLVVTAGENGSSIAQSATSQEVVASTAALLKVFAANSSSVGIAPGIHRIDTHIPAKLALGELLDQKRIVDGVVVKDASTLSSILNLLKHDSLIKPSKALPNPVLPNALHSLEGQLAPDQYSFAPGTTASEAISQMLTQFGLNVKSSGIAAGYGKFTPYQLLTVASLLQIESDPGDYAKVARVIYNRLAIGMALQLNSTVAYALNYQGHIGLSTSQTKVDSPYNTYLHVGLPPTPICNPTMAALAATIHPASGNWLYFITVAPHDTRFTNSYSQFESWVTTYNQNVAKGLFK